MRFSHSLAAALMVVAVPGASEAQIGVRVGVHGATRRQNGSIDHTRVGGRVTLVPYKRFAFSLVVDAVIRDHDDNPMTSFSGSHAAGRVQFIPFTKILYVGWGAEFIHERFRVDRQFSNSDQLDERWQGVTFAGLEYPFGRFHPFVEVHAGNLTGGGSTQWNFAIGLDVLVN